MSVRIVEACIWGGLTASAISFGLDGIANGFEYVAEERATFVTQAAFRQATEQLRDFRDVTGLAAATQLAGACAIYGSQTGLRRRTQ